MTHHFTLPSNLSIFHYLLSFIASIKFDGVSHGQKEPIASAMKGFDCNREGHACRVRFLRSRQARPSRRINPICRRFYRLKTCVAKFPQFVK